MMYTFDILAVIAGTVLNSSPASFARQTAEITDGNGFDVTIEADSFGGIPAVQ